MRFDETIMGGDEQWDIQSKIVSEACVSNMFDYYKNRRILTKELFEENLDKIIEIIKNRYNIHIAYQVFGRFVLLLGVEIPKELIDLIVDASDWCHEEGTWSPKYVAKRRFHLDDLRRKILNYKCGVPNPLEEDLVLYPELVCFYKQRVG